MPDPSRSVLDPLLSRQSRAWEAGDRPTVEEIAAGSPVGADADAMLDLIYNEILLREDRGEAPALAEYAARYPHLRADLELHFEVHRAVEGPDLAETPRLDGLATLPDTEEPVVAAPAAPAEYELLEVLGRGGMGVVYKARHRTLRRLVALKTFEPARQPTPRERLRFRAEAEAMARLEHPNVVRIYEVGEAAGRPFLALELADRGTLADRLRQLPFAPRAAAELVEALARAVGHAHDNGVVHRDLKPANVLFAADGTPKVTDFGLAKVLDDDGATPRDATRTGDPIGTPRYMSPEQAAGRTADIGPAADVYALGTLLYECVTGRVPFLAAGVVETLDLIRTADPPPPRRFQPAVPRDLETICLHALRKDPARRYPTAAALAADLRRFLDRKPIAARPTPAWERAAKWCRRRPGRAAFVAVAVVLAAAGAAALAVFDRVEQTRVASVRAEVDDLVRQGQEAMLRDDDEVAVARFQAAWLLVQGEPALRASYETGVSGLLIHSRQADLRQQWKKRVPPREYDARRDEALLPSLLLEAAPRAEQIRAAREAVATALDFTLPDDAAWRRERELLALIDADLIAAETGPAPALARLDAATEFDSRPYHTRRAVVLDQLGRPADAAAARARADRHPPDAATTRLLTAADRIRRGDFTAAAAELDALLDAEPEHFTARLLRAVCALRLNHPGEARAGLTACVAQRPGFAWAYVYRGRAAAALGDTAAAARAFDRAAGLQPGLPNH